MLSHSLNNFHKVIALSLDHKLLKSVFQSHSHEILIFLDEEDINNLKITNKFFFNLCDCHILFDQSIKSLKTLFLLSLTDDNNLKEQKKSKFKEKFNFNKSINEFYKGVDIDRTRIKSARFKK